MERAGNASPDAEIDLLHLLPEDVPPESQAHDRVKFVIDKGFEVVKFKVGNTTLQVSVKKCGGNPEVALRVGRLCYTKLENGISKEEVSDYRNSLYRLLDDSGNSVSVPLPTLQLEESARETEAAKRKRIPEDSARSEKVTDEVEVSENMQEPKKRKVIEESLLKEWELLLPGEVSQDHAAHIKVKYQASGDLWRFPLSQNDYMQVTTLQAGGREAAGRVARLCYVKNESGASREEILEYRRTLLRKLQYAQWQVKDSPHELPSETDAVDWSNLLPADAPEEHEAYLRINYQSDQNKYFFKRDGVPVQISVSMTMGIRGAAARICRLCFLKLEEGATKEEAEKYKNSFIELLANAARTGAQKSSQAPKQVQEFEKEKGEKDGKETNDLKDTQQRGKSHEEKQSKKQKQELEGTGAKVEETKLDINEKEIKEEKLQEVKKETAKEFRWEDFLPEEVPEDHAAHVQVKYQPSGSFWRMMISDIKNDCINVSNIGACGSKEAAGRVGRLCYVRLESGASKEEVMEYRDMLLKKLQYNQWKVQVGCHELPCRTDVVDWSNLLPADAPEEHDAYLKVNYESRKKCYIFKLKTDGERCQVTVGKALGIRGAAGRIARLCFVRSEEGATKDEVLAYRKSLCDDLANALNPGQAPKQDGEVENGKVEKSKKGGTGTEDNKEKLKEAVNPRRKMQEVKEDEEEEKKKSEVEESVDNASDSGSSSASSGENAKAVPRRAVAKLAVRTGLRCPVTFALQ